MDLGCDDSRLFLFFFYSMSSSVAFKSSWGLAGLSTFWASSDVEGSEDEDDRGFLVAWLCFRPSSLLSLNRDTLE